MQTRLFIGTSGWHYDDWRGLFYPPEIKGYNELSYYATHFNAVENNASFYRIAGESTYKTWYRTTPDNFLFSLKLNRTITHFHKLALDDEVQERVRYILRTTQVLQEKLGAIVIQLPASFQYDLERLQIFLAFFTKEIAKQKYKLDVAIEFRNIHWFNDIVYALLKKHNVALVAGQSSRYPEIRHVTADFVYIRMHGPKELFASNYTSAQLEELAKYIKSISSQVKKIYVYFNNDFHGYAIENAKELRQLLMKNIS